MIYDIYDICLCWVGNMKRRYLRCSYITYKALKITVIIFHILVMRIQKIFESFSKVFEAMTTHKIFNYHSLQKVVRKADLSFSNVLFFDYDSRYEPKATNLHWWFPPLKPLIFLYQVEPGDIVWGPMVSPGCSQTFTLHMRVGTNTSRDNGDVFSHHSPHSPYWRDMKHFSLSIFGQYLNRS